MKIIEATWELKNLGVNSVEIIVENDDSHFQILEVMSSSINFDYTVVKVPVSRFDIHKILSGYGFVFMEGSINFQLKIKDAYLNPIQQRLNHTIGYTQMGENDIIRLFDEISKGLFKSDRIILDDKFTSEQSANRYINWIKSELKLNSQVYKIEYKNQSIGFFILKELNESTFYPFLAGMYSDFLNSGLGFSVLRKPIEEVIKRNGNMISTYASTNNPSIIRTHIQQGFVIGETQYVFIKHKN